MAIAKTTDSHSGRIRLGMVGGGDGASIGGVHRIAARLDDKFELIAGALASDPERALRSGAELGLAADRTYVDFTAMAKREARLKQGIEAVAIVTPNHLHYTVAREFLKRGIHVICDKPLTATLGDARKLVRLVERSETLFILTHNYTGYPMIRHARELVSQGVLGELRLVHVEYLQDWLAEPIEQDGHKQAVWRTDPARSGVGGSTGDIGTHAFNLAEFVAGKQVEAISADVHTFVGGRRVDDNAHVLLRFEGGVKGTLLCSQVAVGNENGLRLRLYGSKAGLEWAQEHPNHLTITRLGEPPQLISRGGAGSGPAAARVTRVPAGHPEGYLEGFANIYSEAANAIIAARQGRKPDPSVIYPDVYDGLRGVEFVAGCITSSKRNGAWLNILKQEHE
jgi:predicted dehydrogenase